VTTIYRRADMLSPGDIVTGTGPSGDYEDGPCTVATIERAPEHAARMMAYRITWTTGGIQVYYGDTILTIQT
jgi:hypothetical protein